MDNDAIKIPDYTFKSYKILLKPTTLQKQKLNSVWNSYKYTYNECVRYLYTLKSKIKQFIKQHQRPYTEEEFNELNELYFKQNEKRIRNVLVTEKNNKYFKNIKNQHLLKTAKSIRQQAVFECVYRYKTLKMMRQQNKIKLFEFKRKKEDHRKTRTINLEKSNLKYDTEKEELTIFLNGKKDTSYKDTTMNYYYRKKNKRILESTMKTQSKLQITPSGKYYLIITLKEEIRIPKQKEKKLEVVSIDPGIRTFYTCYDMDKVYKIKADFKKEQIEQDYLKRIINNDKQKLEWYNKKIKYELNKKIYKTIEKNIDKSEDEIVRKVNEIKIKKTKNMMNITREIRKRIIQIEEKMKNKRKEFGHKVSRFLVDKYETVVIAKLNVKDMVKKRKSVLRTKTRRDFLSIGHSNVISKIEEKGRWCGTKVLNVNERYTSKTCGRCGIVDRKLGGSEWYKCKKCGVEMCRDVNGARNILLRTIEVLD